MKRIKNFDDFAKSHVNESFTITLEQLPSIGDIVDRVDWKAGENIAFIDFKGIKNIPVKIDNVDKSDVEKVEE
jgi:hypothetical protein